MGYRNEEKVLKISVAIDGPAGAGKSNSIPTVGVEISSQQENYRGHVDIEGSANPPVCGCGDAYVPPRNVCEQPPVRAQPQACYSNGRPRS